jgi:hypothetical protein
VIDISLQVGEASQSVVVTGQAQLINTTSGSLTNLVNEQTISDLPLNGRNYVDLALLQPGITKHTNNGTGLPVFSSNGAPIRSNSYLLDGAILSNEEGISAASITGTTLGVDGIREYRVITNSFSAEYGMTMGSQTVMVSKSGTNQFHGDAFEFLRNSALDARNYFDAPPSAIGHRLPEFRRNNFGGSFGGPIQKDKTFFFAVFEGLHQDLGTTNLPTTIEAGCHGPANAVVWNGQGTKPAGSVGPCTSLGANPSGPGTNSVTISPLTAPFLSLYPLPNAPKNGFTYLFGEPTTEYYGQMRVDRIISASDSFFGRYTIDHAEQLQPQGFQQFNNDLASRNQFLTLSESHIFSTNLLNQARFSYSRTSGINRLITTIHGEEFNILAGAPQFGQIDIGGVTVFGLATPYFGTAQNIYSVSDDLYYTHGRHALKFGFLFNHYQAYTLQATSLSGELQFANLANFLTARANTFLGTLPGSIVDRHLRFDTMGFYAQDDFRVNPRLTLNLGLRYEPMTTVTDRDNIIGTVINPLTDATGTVGKPFLNPSLKNFGPRAGFAWDVFGRGRTAIRGGFSYLYDLATYGTLFRNLAQGFAPFDQKFQIVGIPTFPLTQIPYSVPTNGPAPLPNFNGPFYHMQQPHMLQWNLTVEQQLPFQTVLSLSYVGARGLSLLHPEDVDPPLPQGIPQAGACVPRPAGQAINLTSMVDGRATACWLSITPRQNTNWSSVIELNGDGDSYYHGLEVAVTKPLSRGLLLNSAFTWSKLIDDRQVSGGQDNIRGILPTNPRDPFHDSVDRGPGDFDLEFNYHLSAIYNLPKFNALSNHIVLDKLLNGWATSGILSVESGYAFNPLLSQNVSLDKSVGGATLADAPDLLPGRKNFNITRGVSTGCTGVPAGTPLGTPSVYYDPCAFAVQPAGFIGNVPRNSLRGPGFANLDFSCLKDTHVGFLGEAGTIEFRAEFFNILNHANFGLPSAQVFSGTNGQTPLPNAGLITTTANSSRQIQFGLKLIF